MKMDINKICEKLKHFNPQLYIRELEYTLINHARVYKDNNSNIKKDVLYIVKVSSISDLDKINACTNILIISDDIMVTQAIKRSDFNILIINNTMDTNSILKEIIGIFNANQQLLENSFHISELYLHGEGLQQILDNSCQILNNPIFLDDTESKPIAHSTNKNLSDIIKEKIIKSNNSNFDNEYDHNRETRIIEKVHKSKSPVYFISIGDYPSMVSSVVIDNNIVAYLTVYECGNIFSDTDFEFVSFLCTLIAMEMQKNKLSRYSSEYLHEAIILDLLAKNIEDPLSIEDKVKLLSKEFKGNYYVISIEVSQDEMNNTIIPYIRHRLKSIVKNSKIVIYKDHIVIITTRDKENPIRVDDLLELNTFLKRNSLHGGLSRQFSDLKDLWKYFHQSLISIKLGLELDNKKTICFYDDYVHFDILSICSKQIDIKTFCHQSLSKLLDYDRKNETDYVQIIYIYLKNKKNQTETAKKLNIYRRTVSYRINKIKELVNIDLDNEESTFHLYLSCKILEYIGEMNL